MLSLRTEVRVEGASAVEIFDFLIDPDDESYRAWWPGTHHQLHPVARGPDHVGDVIYMDEHIGRRRLRMTGIVEEAVRGRRIAWRLKRGIKLPARLVLDLHEEGDAVAITHTVRIGSSGPGRMFDPLLRALARRGFAQALDQHVLTEFPLVADLLRSRRRG
jgi:hypothetical protein